jgi:hypothetical protein
LIAFAIGAREVKDLFAIRIVPLSLRNPDRHARQVERLTQAVHQKSLVARRQFIKLIPK